MGSPVSIGYVYLTFECEKSVKTLLMACTHDPSNGGQYYFKVSSRRMRNKEVCVLSTILYQFPMDVPLTNTGANHSLGIF